MDSYNVTDKTYSGRRAQDAPEIDNEVIINAAAYGSDLVGTYQEVEIKDATEYELYAEFCAVNGKERVA